MSTDLEVEGLKLSKELGLEWFKIHADQRLRMFNFFLLVAGFCIGGFFTSLQIKSAIAASTVAFLLGLVCICFKLLDMRTSQLLKHGEKLLESCFLQFEAGSGGSIPNLIKLADQRDGVPSYRQVFNALFLSFGVMAVIGIIFPWFFVKGCLP
jgi:xanthosine utilization system XapX-like protein